MFPVSSEWMSFRVPVESAKIPPAVPAAELLVIFDSRIVKFSTLSMAPPLPAALPSVAVIPEISTSISVPEILSVTLKIRVWFSPLMISLSDPGPMIVSESVIKNSALSVTIVSATSSVKLVPPDAEPSPKLMVSAPGLAFA